MDEHLSEIQTLFRSIVVLGMFFSRQYNKNDTSKLWEFTTESESHNAEKASQSTLATTQKYTIEIKNKSSVRGCFNIMNFVSCAFEYDKNAGQIENELYDFLFCGEEKENSKQLILNKIGIKKEFDQWNKYSGGFVLPLYNMDLCYNLMKRVRQSRLGQSKTNGKKANEIQKCIIEIYKFIAGKLKSNDEYYVKMNGIKLYTLDGVNSNYDGYRISFKEAFEKCPYIKWFLEPQDYLCENFNIIFEEMLINLVSSDHSVELENQEQEVVVGYDDLGY